jgi:hypothetical protein
MERTSNSPAKEAPNLVRAAPFSLERLLNHVDPSPVQESEEFVRAIYEQRRNDVTAGGGDENRR